MASPLPVSAQKPYQFLTQISVNKIFRWTKFSKPARNFSSFVSRREFYGYLFYILADNFRQQARFSAYLSAEFFSENKMKSTQLISHFIFFIYIFKWVISAPQKLCSTDYIGIISGYIGINRNNIGTSIGKSGNSSCCVNSIEFEITLSPLTAAATVWQAPHQTSHQLTQRNELLQLNEPLHR